MSSGDCPFPTVPQNLDIRYIDGAVSFMVYPEDIPDTAPVEFFNNAFRILRQHVSLPVIQIFIQAIKNLRATDEYLMPPCWPPKDEEIPDPLMELNITLSNGVILSPAALLWFSNHLLATTRVLPPQLEFFRYVNTITLD